MKIYILIHEFGEEYKIVGIFNHKEIAERAIELLEEKFDFGGFVIEEFEVFVIEEFDVYIIKNKEYFV
ncbi:MAG: hypothetical protein R3250_00160 [Melioribacteraceae bacterium]|nr:hypothetical protein [Melioribacteraceae bacterium]